MGEFIWNYSNCNIKVEYSTKYVITNHTYTVTVNLKASTSSTYNGGTVYPDGIIYLTYGSTTKTLCIMSANSPATHYANSSGNINSYSQIYNSNGSEAKFTVSGIPVGTSFTIKGLGNTYYSGQNIIWVYHSWGSNWYVSTTNQTITPTGFPSRYILSINSTGSTVTVKRKTSPSAGAAIGNIGNNSYIYTNDTLEISAAANTGYNTPTLKVNNSIVTSPYNLTVNGGISVVSTATLKTYTISYKENSDTKVTNMPTSQTKTHGTNLTLSSTKPSRSSKNVNRATVTFNSNGGVPASSTATATNTHSYTFSKWNTAANGSGDSYNPGASYTNNSNATLYAQWTETVTKNSITTPIPTRQENATAIVTLDANGGSVSSSSLTSSGVENYSCAGWYTAASGGTFRANAGATYSPSNNETLYAHWSSLGFIYDIITLPTPTRGGHEFLGWSINQSDTSGIIGSYTPTGNVTLYAIWKAKGAARIKTSSSSEMKMHLVMIHTPSGWKQHIPLIFTKNGWKIFS